jgi:hypothetical protein
MKLRIFGFAAFAVILGCSATDTSATTTEAPVTGVAIGEVRGVVDITKTLRTRLFDEADPQTIKFDVSRVAGPVFRLRKQLGVFALEGTSSSYLGGTPTPLRATLWHQVMGRFAAAVGEMCLDPSSNKLTFAAYASGPNGEIVAPSSFRLRPAVASLVGKVCTANDEEATGALFDAFMGLGGTLAAERASFVTAFSAGGSPVPKDRVAEMVLAMLLNPHFLLAK